MSVKKYKQKLGVWGEQLAEKYYQQLGWRTLAKNFRTPYGEIDLLLKKNDFYLAIEVKTRRGKKYGWAEECIDQAKIERLENSCLWAQEKLNLTGQWQIEILIIDLKNGRAQLRRLLI
ncbi:MAG: hypothetical protein C3F02_02065 [Parcubacteria group bacterium]|nr:MAG: hypothetical protein C3F02_02065 [Parcubacteria group bacterium]